ncbi:MAG: shikimate kinase [Magnetococcales bacterium]|nr:shikimate kinase [Magnetococcales bacterium]
MNIVLIGPRGVGKSSLSRHLSLLTRRPVVATDLLISYENDGLPIPDLLQRHHGDWRRFRDLEYAVVEKVARLDHLIVDAGGGVVVDLDPEGGECFSHRKIAALKRNGFLIWLTGDLQLLAQKAARDAGRPALSDALSEESIMRRREPFYRQAADLAIPVDGRKRMTLAKTLLGQLPFAARL